MSTTPTPEAPSPELLRMHNAGQLLANCAFNIAQHAGEPVSESVAATLKQCQTEWDAACLAFKAARAALTQGAGEAVEPVAWFNKHWSLTPSALADARKRYPNEAAFADMRPAYAAPTSMVPMFYTVFCFADRQGAPLGLPQYSHQHESGVLDLVLAGARREGFKGTAAERMAELGWRVGPVFA